MSIILVSGSPGRRSWPLSNSNRAKQYLSVLEGPYGALESRVQRLWRQLDTADLQEQCRFVTSEDQVELLHKQLGMNAPLIVEPIQRDSFPTAAMAAVYLYSVENVSLDETIIFMRDDIVVENSFFHCIRSLPKLLRESESQLMLVGTEAVIASSMHDYILPEKEQYREDAGLYDRQVKDFIEKPYENEAQNLIKEGALWNTGIYACQLSLIIDKLLNRGCPVQYDELYQHYYKLRKSSLEQQIVARRIINKSVVRYDGIWNDLSLEQKLYGEAMFR